MAAPEPSSWDLLLDQILGDEDPPPQQFNVSDLGDEDDPMAAGHHDAELATPNVSPEAMVSFLSPAWGRQQDGSIAPVLQQILKIASNNASFEVNEVVAKVMRFYLSGGKTLHCSKAAIALMLQTPAKSLEPTLVTLVDSLLHLDKRQRQEVEAACCQGHLKPILYIDSTRFDETPMKVRVKDVLTHPKPAKNIFPHVQALHFDANPDPSAALATFFTQTTAVCKLFAVDDKFTILLKEEGGSTADDTAGTDKYYVVQGQSLCHLQCLERATGPTLLQGLLENLAVSSSVQAQRIMKVRSTCTDQAGSNKVAEDSCKKVLGADWHGLHYPCNVHKIARTLQKVTLLMKEHIAGLLHFALAFETASSMSQFRAALSQVIAARPLVVHRGQPPAHVREYQEFCLNLFGHTGSKQEAKRYLIRAVVNGDWRRRDCLEYYVPAGVADNHDELHNTIRQGLLVALTSKVFSKYPRHRWLGCDTATDEIGLLECIHGLGSACGLHAKRWASSAEARPGCA